MRSSTLQSIEQALQRLQTHASYDSKCESSFLFSLRPYRGLKPEVFADLIDTLISLAPVFQQDTIPRSVVADSFSIIALARSWGLSRNGLLRRNKLISDIDCDRLERWLATLEATVHAALHRDTTEEVAWPYISYFVREDRELPAVFLVPLANKMLTSQEEGVPETAAEFLEIALRGLKGQNDFCESF
jgi:hypothetical protein